MSEAKPKQESDIAVSSKRDSSSESESEEEPDYVWTTENSPVHVDDTVERTGPNYAWSSRRWNSPGFLSSSFSFKDIFAKIVEETNRNAEHCIRTKPY